jgi:DNA-binding transcriptional LysR family regulator
VAVAEELHFARAAARLHLSQPPLTQQIQRLEARVGHPLLRRSSRRVELTPAGRAFYDAARAVLFEARTALEGARRIGEGEAGLFTIATPPSLMLDALPLIIRRFRERFPAVDLRLRELSTTRIFEALEAGLADVGFVRTPRASAPLRTLASWREPIVALLPPAHRRATGRFSLKQLAGEPWVFFPRSLGPDFYEELVDHCRAAGFEPRVIQEATQWSSVLGLVSAGLGVTIGPGSIARLLTGAVEVRPLPGLSTQVQLVASAGREHPATAQFVKMVKASYRSRET